MLAVENSDPCDSTFVKQGEAVEEEKEKKALESTAPSQPPGILDPFPRVSNQVAGSEN